MWSVGSLLGLSQFHVNSVRTEQSCRHVAGVRELENQHGKVPCVYKGTFIPGISKLPTQSLIHLGKHLLRLLSDVISGKIPHSPEEPQSTWPEPESYYYPTQPEAQIPGTCSLCHSRCFPRGADVKRLETRLQPQWPCRLCRAGGKVENERTEHKYCQLISIKTMHSNKEKVTTSLWPPSMR